MNNLQQKAQNDEQKTPPPLKTPPTPKFMHPRHRLLNRLNEVNKKSPTNVSLTSKEKSISVFKEGELTTTLSSDSVKPVDNNASKIDTSSTNKSTTAINESSDPTNKTTASPNKATTPTCKATSPTRKATEPTTKASATTTNAT